MREIVLYIPSIEAGGVEKNLFYILDYFCKKFGKIYLVTATKIQKFQTNKKIVIIKPKSNFYFKKSRILKTVVCFFLMIKYFRKKKILILSFQSNFSSIIVSKFLDSKIILRLNTSTEKYINNFIKKFLFKIIYSLANDLIVNSQEFGKNFKRFFGLKTNVILNPIKQKIIKQKKIEFFKNFNGLKILNIGRLTDQKDHLTLLEAAKLLKFKYDLEFKIYIIGRGYNHNLLNNFIKNNGLTKNVKIAGFKKDAYVYLKSSDLFVLTSKYEGLPNTLLESQLANVPIISTNCSTGPKEILLNGKLGDIFKVGDYQNLAKKINNFSSKKNILKKKSSLAKKYFYRYNYEYNLDKYVKLIKKNLYK